VVALGVDGIWLSPFFPSPMKDFGYDVSDYRQVDPLFGSLAEFDRIVERAHALGLKVIIDQVWSHTSDRHPWFIESSQSRNGPRADWYVWADARPDGTAPNNWMAVFGGPSWAWGPKRRQYYLHNFLIEQPDLNYWNSDVQDAILAVARFWLDRGVDGFRLDVINLIFHDRALADNPPRRLKRPAAMPTLFQKHLHDRSRPQALAFVARLRALSDQYDGRMTVGEVIDEAPLARQLEYTAGPDRLHTAYSFFLLAAGAATPELFAEALTSWSGAAGWPSWSLGNHDVERFASRLAHSGDATEARMLLAVLLTLRGTIFLYQGEELGLPQASVPFEALRDPFAIAEYTGGSGRDGARTPMPWSPDGPSAGFSATAATWLPVDPAHRPLAVAAQEGNPKSALEFVRALILLRRDCAALRLGDAEVLTARSGLLAFTRAWAAERLVCVFEFSGRGAEFSIGEEADILLAVTGGERLAGGVLRLPPFGGAVLKLR
jgi:alpha-glucosidase